MGHSSHFNELSVCRKPFEETRGDFCLVEILLYVYGIIYTNRLKQFEKHFFFFVDMSFVLSFSVYTFTDVKKSSTEAGALSFFVVPDKKGSHSCHKPKYSF